MEQCVTTERLWMVLIWPTKKEGESQENKRGFREHGMKHLFRKRQSQLPGQGARWVEWSVVHALESAVALSLSWVPLYYLSLFLYSPAMFPPAQISVTAPLVH